ncbi:MAG TPA: outer membrane protein transport protein, partial [Bacillota bacterium]|nr:outer membrane protein transport protein [Bacillota bacterium]
KNPAGMSLLAGTQFQGGLQLTYGQVEFSPNASTSPRLGNDPGGNAIGALPAASFFVTAPLSERVTLGFGTFSYFGLIEDYNDNWVGRYYLQYSALLGMSLMPAVSFKVTDWLSIGGGPNIMYGYLKDQVAVNNLTPGLADGQLEVKDHAWGAGGVGGILLQPCEGTRLGATYVSEVKLDFSTTPNFTGLGPGLSRLLAFPPSLDLGVTVPQSVMVGLYQELTPQWALMADVGWQNWNQFGKVEVGVDSATPGGPQRTTTAQLQFQDTWHGALGLQYKFSPGWRLSGGVAYDSSAEESANRTVVLPLGQTWRFGLGAEYQLTEKLNVGAGYTFAWNGNLSVDQGSDQSVRGRVAGSYKDAWFSFLTLNASYKF